MIAVDELIAFVRAQLDEDERVAREASRDGEHSTPTGEHWHWVEPDRDEVLTLDPMLDEYVNDGSQASLRSVEEYPTSMPYTLPHFVVSHAEEVPTVCGMHIARWDPARVLAEVEAKRRILELHQPGGRLEGDGYPVGGFMWCETCGSGEPNEYPVSWPCETVRLLAQPYAGRPGWREEWAV